MSPEGHVRLAFAKELAAIADADERRADFERRLSRVREDGYGLNLAEHFELDDVIDPAETRSWISRGLTAAGETPAPARRWVDPW
jgi:acetyl-CoA carboxylase carboxyltransferase component